MMMKKKTERIESTHTCVGVDGGFFVVLLNEGLWVLMKIFMKIVEFIFK
jgi:hypothetical protein